MTKWQHLFYRKPQYRLSLSIIFCQKAASTITSPHLTWQLDVAPRLAQVVLCQTRVVPKIWLRHIEYHELVPGIIALFKVIFSASRSIIIWCFQHVHIFVMNIKNSLSTKFSENVNNCCFNKNTIWDKSALVIVYIYLNSFLSYILV